MYERILVPLDGSNLAKQVIPFVVEMSRAFGSEVILVGVCEAEESEEGQACRLYINSEAEQLRNSMVGSVASVREVVLSGRPAEQIVGYAEKNDISLIIISSHGRSGIAPWSLGSTVYKVLHRVGAPLVIIRARETPEEELAKDGPFCRIIMPLDGSERGEAALPYVIELTRKLEAEVILLRIVESGRKVHSVRGLEYIPYKDQDADALKVSAHKYLEEVSSTLAGTKAIVRCEVRVGDCAREIIKFAGEVECSLIAMASHGHSGFEVWIYGSVTHKILHASNQSVWLVLSPGIHR